MTRNEIIYIKRAIKKLQKKYEMNDDELTALFYELIADVNDETK